jgi:hypothetical protein
VPAMTTETATGLVRRLTTILHYFYLKVVLVCK